MSEQRAGEANRLPSALFDTHCHLDFAPLYLQRETLLAASSQQGLRHLLIPGVREADWSRIEAILARVGSVELWGALGLHPSFAAEHSDEHLLQLERRLAEGSERVIALGEVGLDAWPGIGYQAEQEYFFNAQLNLAQQFDLPLLLHVRKAHDQVLASLRKYSKTWPTMRGIVHAFSGSLQQGLQYYEMGFRLGVGGACTYPRAKKLQRTLAALPRAALVLETDAPDMAPCWARGQVNSPLNLPGILAALAHIRQESIDSLAEVLFANSCALFSPLSTPVCSNSV